MSKTRIVLVLSLGLNLLVLGAVLGHAWRGGFDRGPPPLSWGLRTLSPEARAQVMPRPGKTSRRAGPSAGPFVRPGKRWRRPWGASPLIGQGWRRPSRGCGVPRMPTSSRCTSAPWRCSRSFPLRIAEPWRPCCFVPGRIAMAHRGREGAPPESGRRARRRVLKATRSGRPRETVIQRKRPRSAGPF